MLKDKRKEIIKHVKDHHAFIRHNYQVLDIYEGNLLEYVQKAMQSSLSPQYYHAIKDRILPVNILQRFIDKVSTAYQKPPVRESDAGDWADEWAKALNLNVSGMLADAYANMHKGFAWEPYVDKDGKPALRELSFDRFLVMSESEVNPEEETIFIKFMGMKSDDPDSLLLHVYTNEEFDAFYLSGAEASEYLAENQGINIVGTIPFVYGKRQKNTLIPKQDTDILAFSKAIPIMLSDAAGAQMFQCFSVLWAIDVELKDLKLSPNAIWDIKSDRSSDKNPQIGVVKPEADTDKVVQFVVNMFVLWLETKGIRVGSIGNIESGNVASGIAKIVDEMDVNAIRGKSQKWFKRDEEELFNRVLPKLSRYWIESGMVDSSLIPALVDEPNVVVTFQEPEPMMSRTELLTNIERELNIGTMTLEQAIKKLHPELDADGVALVVAQRFPV